MRPFRLTVFLWILMIATIMSVFPRAIGLIGNILAGRIDLTEDLLTTIFMFLAIALSVFSIIIITRMFRMEAWARNSYIVLTAFSQLMNLINGNFIIVVISLAIHVFVFWNTWDDFY